VIGAAAEEAQQAVWLGVSSLEDPSRDFMYASIVVEKETGYIYSFPSRARQPIDAADIASIREGCTRITLADLDWLAPQGGHGASGKNRTRFKQGWPNQGDASEGPRD
jgi:hypothetical protein